MNTRQENTEAWAGMPTRWILATVSAFCIWLCLCAPCQAGVTVGLYFVEGAAEPMDFLTIDPLPPYNFIEPWPVTDPANEFVTDGAFAGLTEQQVRDAVVALVREKYYSIPVPAGYMLDIDFVDGQVSGSGTVNCLLGRHNFTTQTWFGYTKVNGGLGEINGENNSAVSMDRIDSLLTVEFTNFDDALNAVSNVVAHEVGHLFGLVHVWADESAPGWEPGDVVVTDPYDLMATGPTGLPDTGWIADNIFTTVPGTQANGNSSVSLLIQKIGLRLIGDLDLDGDVDNADIGRAVGLYTGANGSGMTYADGDMDFDGDVDNADIGLLVGAYTGASGGQAVPEPGSALLFLAVTGLCPAVLRGRRRKNRR